MINRYYYLPTITFLGCILLQILCSTNVVNAAAAAANADIPDGSTITTTLPRRERHLDFMDAATLAYYLGLDEVTGEKLTTPPAPSDSNHNVAVMFYAQWDRNSHSLAPIWDQIGQILVAGSRQPSNLILGLFDCEVDQQHLALCHAAGITHYPTIMFMSPSRTFPHTPSLTKKQTAAVKLPHTTTFQGVWQYDKSILDWLRTMQRMAGWSAFWNRRSNKNKKSKGGQGGWWQAASYDPSTANSLPVGIPSSAGGGATISSSIVGNRQGATDTATAANTAQQTAALEEAVAAMDQYEQMVLRSSILLDSTLFPVAEETSQSTDLFSFLMANQGWDAIDPPAQVMRTCAMEISLDYCTRLTHHKTTELVNAKAGNTDNTLAELEAELKIMIATAEPFCDSLEACIMGEFAAPECRATACPFQKEAACNYLSSCFDASVQNDYAVAMGLTLPKTTAATAM